MAVRMAIAAGRFYSANHDDCLSDLRSLLLKGQPPTDIELPAQITAGIVPHAGWVFSGDLCAMLFNAIKARQTVDTFILFGANHSVNSHNHMIYDVGQWASPLGTIDVDQQIASEMFQVSDGLLHANCQGHANEHSLEVIVPFIQFLFPDAQIVPIMVQPIESATEIGKIAADIVDSNPDKKIVIMGSTDLTHYGPSYYNTAMGTGKEAVEWAKNVNDKYMIDLICAMKFGQVVETAKTYANACGAGAIAASVKYAFEKGVTKGILIEHTCSSEVFSKKFGRADFNSVGYAAIAF